MKIPLSFVTLAGAAVLAVNVCAAQASVGEGHARAAQMQAAKAAKLQYRAATHYFKELRRHHVVVPSSMRGQDQLSTPGWSNELPF